MVSIHPKLEDKRERVECKNEFRAGRHSDEHRTIYKCNRINPTASFERSLKTSLRKKTAI